MNIKGPVCHNVGITGFGNIESKVFIIGIAPGTNEIKEGVPFIGSSGKLLNETLRATGWNREDVYCTNLVCTVHNESTPQEIVACYPRLLREIQTYKPKLIITLGKIVSETINPEYTFGQARGNVFWLDNFQCYTLATYHPSAILHGLVDLSQDFINDLGKIGLIVKWKPKVANAEIKYKVVESAQEVNSWLNKQTEVSVDVETQIGKNEDGDIDIFEDQLLIIGLANTKEALIVPYSLCKDIVWPNWVKYFGHNFQFDVQMIERFLGVHLTISDDTMLMNHTLDERKGQHKLKQLTPQYLGSGFYSEDLKKERKKGNMRSIATNTLYEYNARDAIYTARLKDIFNSKLMADETYDIYRNLSIPATNMFSEVNYRGIYVNPIAIRDLGLDWLPRVLEDEEKLVTYAKELGYPGDINVRSWQQLSRLLYGILHLPGGPSVDKEHLEALHGMHPYISLLEDHKDLEYNVSHWLIPINNNIKLDKRVHPNVLQHGTVTYRLAYVKPPLQTFTKIDVDDEFDLARNIKTLFAATNDDYILVEADYEAAELYAAAAISGDKILYNDLIGVDFHRTAAAAYFNIPYEDVTDLIRKAGKTITFGELYNLGSEKAALKMNVSVQEAKEMLDNKKKRYWRYNQWKDEIKKEVLNTGEILSPTGNKRRLPFVGFSQDKLWHYINEAVNQPIQNVATQTTLSAAVELHPLLKKLDSYILFLVHDAIYFEVSKTHLTEAIKIIKEVMVKPHFKGMYPVPIEIKVGKDLGHMEKYK